MMKRVTTRVKSSKMMKKFKISNKKIHRLIRMKKERKIMKIKMMMKTLEKK